MPPSHSSRISTFVPDLTKATILLFSSRAMRRKAFSTTSPGIEGLKTRCEASGAPELPSATFNPVVRTRQFRSNNKAEQHLFNCIPDSSSLDERSDQPRFTWRQAGRQRVSNGAVQGFLIAACPLATILLHRPVSRYQARTVNLESSSILTGERSGVSITSAIWVMFQGIRLSKTEKQ